VTSPTGGAAGARFDHARDVMFLSRGIATKRARVTRVSERSGRWVLELDETEDRTSKELEAVAVVLATGGVAAGGVTLGWQPGEGSRGFTLPFEAPALLSLDDELVTSGGSLFGPTLERLGLGALERVGIATSDNGLVYGPEGETRGLFAAGDAVAKRPRTVLRAVHDGIRAGALATKSH
jgi:glycerol-3-phosphate dehydrogenase subunit B